MHVKQTHISGADKVSTEMLTDFGDQHQSEELVSYDIKESM
jgi:hypothetical protein